MNCNGCIANTMAQAAYGNNREAYSILAKAKDTCGDLRRDGICDMQLAALLLDTRRPVVVEVKR